MKRVWVLGARGMLGAAVIRALRRSPVKLYQYHESFDWTCEERVRPQFERATREFLAGLVAGDDWEVYWAAGVGAMGSSRADLDVETAVLGAFLAVLAQGLSVCGVPGALSFASSAGALYAGSEDFEITENTPIAMRNDYAVAKRAQERLFEDFATRQVGVHILLARFSTLYGPGQAQGKRQGLLSHIARCALRHQPVEIFVPLDTSRDYLFVDDAACDFIESARALRAHGARVQIKIIAAERSVTISEIVATFNRLNKRRLRVVCNRNNLSAMYARRVAYRSVSPLAADMQMNRHALLEGAAALLRSERMVYIAGSKKG